MGIIEKKGEQEMAFQLTTSQNYTIYNLYVGIIDLM